MQRVSELTLTRALLIAVASSLIPCASAFAGGDDDNDNDSFVETATLAELDEAGYIIDGTNDVDGRMVNFQHVMDERAVALGRLSEAAFWQQAVELQGVLELVDLSNDLSLVELVPSATGGIAAPTIVMDFSDLSQGPDHGALSAAIPSGKGFAAEWTSEGHDQDGNEHLSWCSGGTLDSSDGVTTKRIVRTPEGLVIEAVSSVTRLTDDGHIQEERAVSTLRQDGSTETTYEVYEDGKLTKRTQNWTEGGTDPIGVTGTPDKKVKLPPADGDGEVYCPLYLPACRAALEEVQEQAGSAVKLLTGYVFINPGDASQDPDPAPNLVDNPDPFATNPDPNNVTLQGKVPDEAVVISLPVLVLPPPPSQ